MPTRTGRLEVSTPNDREITLRRELDAPRDLVWRAYTRPELVRRWLLGPDGWSFAQCDMDVRVGGTYRWVWRRDADGWEMGAGGTFREVVPMERLVHTERFDEPIGHSEALVTVTFVERAGRTTVTTNQRVDSQQIRDAILASGMAGGVERSYERLDAILPALGRAADGAAAHIDPPAIGESSAQQAAVIHLTIAREQIREVMGPAILEVIAAALAQGIGPASPVFSHHFRMEPGTFDFEVGVPVRGVVTPSGRVRAGELPAARVVRTVYRGGYEGLPAAWGAFDQAAREAGIATREELWERYVVGPKAADAPERYETELVRPLSD